MSGHSYMLGFAAGIGHGHGNPSNRATPQSTIIMPIARESAGLGIDTTSGRNGNRASMSPTSGRRASIGLCVRVFTVRPLAGIVYGWMVFARSHCGGARAGRGPRRLGRPLGHQSLCGDRAGGVRARWAGLLRRPSAWHRRGKRRVSRSRRGSRGRLARASSLPFARGSASRGCNRAGHRRHADVASHDLRHDSLGIVGQIVQHHRGRDTVEMFSDLARVHLREADDKSRGDQSHYQNPLAEFSMMIPRRPVFRSTVLPFPGIASTWPAVYSTSARIRELHPRQRYRRIRTPAVVALRCGASAVLPHPGHRGRVTRM